MTLLDDSLISHGANCLAAEVGEDVVIMSVDKGVYVSLDPIGRHIWKRIASPCRFDALCADLLQHYDAPLGTIKADVADLIAALAKVSAVRIGTEPPAPPCP